MPAQKIFVFMCAGCKKGKCFPKEDEAAAWRYIKSYRRREEYKDIVIREAACLDMCEFTGPNLLIIDGNGKDTTHSLGAKNIEEAKKRIDEVMEKHAANTVVSESGCCGRECPECECAE